MSIVEAINRVVEYLEANPETARSTDVPATATVDGLRSTVTGPGGATIVVDMPESVGGTGTAPTPGWLMRAALASCDAIVIAMRAATEGVELESLEVTVESESDDRGLVGIGDAPAGPLSTTILVRIAATGADPATLRRIVEWADDHSPVGEAMRRAIPVTVNVHVS